MNLLTTGRQNELNVVCFYWHGKDRPNWGKAESGVRYINNLYRAVKKHLTLPHGFHCFLGCEVEGLDAGIRVKQFDSPSWMGCFPKLYAFNPDNGLGGRVVVLDLDLVITGSLNEMFSYPGKMMTREAFKRPGQSGGDTVFFEAGTSDLWQQFSKKTSLFEQELRGRERMVYRKYCKNLDFVQRLYSGQMVSYRHSIRRKGGPPDNCRIVTCHGNPRPHMIDEEWRKEFWR